MAPWVWHRERLRCRRAGQTATSCLSSTGELRCRAGVLRRPVDVLQIKLEEAVGLCAVVLGAETPFSIKENADD